MAQSNRAAAPVSVSGHDVHVPEPELVTVTPDNATGTEKSVKDANKANSTEADHVVHQINSSVSDLVRPVVAAQEEVIKE